MTATSPPQTTGRLRLYYQGTACFLLGEHLNAGKALNQLTPFTDPVFGNHARYLLARVYHVTGEQAEATLLGARLADEAGFTARAFAVADARSVAQAIVDAADELAVDLIVMGSRGLGGVKALIGSVSRHVVEQKVVTQRAAVERCRDQQTQQHGAVRGAAAVGGHRPATARRWY